MLTIRGYVLCLCRIAQVADPVVRALHLSVLPRNDVADRRREILLFHRLFVLCNGHVLAALAFVEDRVVVPRGNRRFQVDPCAVKRAGSAAGLLRIVLAEGARLVLELARKAGPLERILTE